MRWFMVLIVSFALSFGWVSAQPETCAETAGRVERQNFYASDIETRIYYSVYLPPCYDATLQTYPVIYLMHGSNDDDGQWGRLGLYDVLDAGIAEGTLPLLIAVMPFGEWIANENRFGPASWPDVFLNELMPLVESQYRIEQNRAARAIGGISRGGFWAFHLAFSNPVLFSAVGGHSAFFDDDHVPPDVNPLDLALNAPNIGALRIWLDHGRDDYAAPGLVLMDARLQARGVPYQYTVYPEGQHANSYWSQHVAAYVDFYAEAWQITPQPQDAVTATPLPDVTMTATNPPTPTESDTTGGQYLLLPVVAFPSFQLANLESERLNAILEGQADAQLVLMEEVAAQLRALGVPLAAETRLVPNVYTALWQNRTLFTLLPFDQLTPRYRVLRVDELHPLDRADYPLRFETETPNFYPDRLTRVLLSGVTALTRETRDALDANGIAWAAGDAAFLDYVMQPDIFHVSNEVSLFAGCPQPSEQMLGGPTSFCSKPPHFDLLTLLDVDVVELSGNHNNDFGYQVYRDTLQWYGENGLRVLGGGETVEAARQPFILEQQGNSIAMLACNDIGPYYALANDDDSLLGGARPGAAACDDAWLQETLAALSTAHDVVVLTVQGPEFDQFNPPEAQMLRFRQFADWGADVVIGTSSHFPQTFEFVAQPDADEALLHYGLGNLFFDQAFFGGVRFFMDQLFIYEGRLLTLDLFTGIIEGQGRPRPMTPDERQNFLYLIFNEHGSF
ncbi:MAG: hypothetical protein OHK0046_05800 [Anaerolineae bacterium]